MVKCFSTDESKKRLILSAVSAPRFSQHAPNAHRRGGGERDNDDADERCGHESGGGERRVALEARAHRHDRGGGRHRHGYYRRQEGVIACHGGGIDRLDDGEERQRHAKRHGGREQKPERSREVCRGLGENVAHAHVGDADAHYQHGYGRRGVGEIFGEDLYLFHLFEHEKVYFRHKEEQKRDDARHDRGVENDFLEGNLLSVTRDEVYAHRPAEHAEDYVEDHHIDGSERIVVGEHLDEGHADKAAVGKECDEGIDARRGLVLILDEDKFADAEEQQKRHGRDRHDDGEVAKQVDFGHGAYHRPLLFVEHAERVDDQHRLTDVEQDRAQRFGGIGGEHFYFA